MDKIIDLAERVGRALSGRRQVLTTAESCTGGWVAQAVTSVAGSSQWFERGFVTYTNVAKQEMLGVSEQTLRDFGAVSEATVKEMAEGALRHSHADVALSISGIAGPGGGSEAKPVGPVCFGWAGQGRPTRVKRLHLEGDRQQVRYQSVVVALKGVLEFLDQG